MSYIQLDMSSCLIIRHISGPGIRGLVVRERSFRRKVEIANGEASGVQLQALRFRKSDTMHPCPVVHSFIKSKG